MKFLFRSLNLVGGLLVLTLVIITFAAVLARYLLGAPLQWTEEMSGILMLWIVFIGAIGCEIEKSHLHIDVVTSLLSERAQRFIAVLVAAGSVWLLGWMAWLGYQLADKAALKKTPILKVSWFWLDIAVTVGVAGIACVLLVRLISAFLVSSTDLHE
ncbi:MAG: TRAP transporter small permease [Rhodobacterales bacterium]